MNQADEKPEDRPATSDDIAKINKGEEIEEAVGEYSYTLEYNGERNGYTKHKLTITSPEGESKEVADDFTYFEPEEQGDMQDELESWFKNGHGVGDEQEESIEEGHCDVCGDGSDEMGPPEAEEQESPNMKNIRLLKQVCNQSRLVQIPIDELKVLLEKLELLYHQVNHTVMMTMMTKNL